MSVYNTRTLGEHVLLELLKLRSKFSFGRSRLPKLNLLLNLNQSIKMSSPEFYSISVNTQQDSNVSDENCATDVVTCISMDIFL